MAARTVVTDRPPASSELRPARHRAVHRVVVPLAPGRPVAVEKTVALHTSRDTAISDPLGAAVDRVFSAADFAGLPNSHVAAWERLWRRAEIQVPSQSGRVLRFHLFHLFHLLLTLSPHTADLDVGVPARGLHGEAYRGHVFWDELFVLPYLNLHFPEVSRALLNYRYRRLPRACEAAAATGRAGAMYPWQSGSDGREETQEWHLNPHSGRWLPDHSRLQHHVGSAIAYNVWQYCEATGDTEFLHTRGAEMLLQIARFWADLAVSDPATERYHIRGVVGPDEYHDSYPGAVLPGLEDNAYTNVTAAWVLGRALDLLRRLPPGAGRMGIRDCPAAVSGSDRRHAHWARETGPGSAAARRRSSWGQSHSSIGVPVVVWPVAYRCWTSWPAVTGSRQRRHERHPAGIGCPGAGGRPLREEAPHG